MSNPCRISTSFKSTILVLLSFVRTVFGGPLTWSCETCSILLCAILRGLSLLKAGRSTFRSCPRSSGSSSKTGCVRKYVLLLDLSNFFQRRFPLFRRLRPEGGRGIQPSLLDPKSAVSIEVLSDNIFSVMDVSVEPFGAWVTNCCGSSLP